MLGPIEIAVSALVLAVAGFAIGAIGFGFGLTTTPIMLLYLDPQTVVIVVNAVAVLAFGLVLIETREHVPYRDLTPTAIAGALGAPIGVYALSELDPSSLRIGISVLVLALTALVVIKTEWRVPKPKLTGPVLGFCVAVLVTGLAIGGPFLVLFFLGRGMERQGVRASMAYFFMVMYVTALAGYFIQGLMTSDRLLLIVATAPAIAVGYWLSVRLTGRMNEKVFRQAVVVVIAVMSTMVLVREVFSL